ncbi:MAG TPA: hypothetical protein VKU79_01245 [Thermoplasmataceae archaeon]|nr:hypothetical protein [Thermoplasmataceae archaeon]
MNKELEEVLLQLPLKLEEIVEKFELPVVIYRDNWGEITKFLLTKVVIDEKKLRAFGHFIYNIRQSGMKELYCTFCKYRVKRKVEK